MKKSLSWLPRVLAILYIAFISLFALDVFEQPQWFLALIMHLIPTYIFTILTIFAWKNQKYGGWLFIFAGIVLAVLTNFEALIIAIPTIIIGGLFLLSTTSGK